MSSVAEQHGAPPGRSATPAPPAARAASRRGQHVAPRIDSCITGPRTGSPQLDHASIPYPLPTTASLCFLCYM